jgi:hypothetical protein
MKKILVSLAAFLSLTACPQPQEPLNDIEPSPTPTPFAWSANLPCSGAITRAQWLTCDNPQLAELHRRLAYQWQTGSQGASPQRMAVIEQQQRALVAERDACEDAVCVRNAYLRYLPPTATPTPATKPPVAKPPKKWVKPAKRPVKWRPRPPRGDGEWRDVDAGRSCSADIGLPGAQELARQCDRVTAGQGWSCRPDRSCASLRRNIAKGCNETYRKPGFCERP